MEKEFGDNLRDVISGIIYDLGVIILKVFGGVRYYFGLWFKGLISLGES